MRLKEKADRAAKALGKTKADIVELNIENNGGGPVARADDDEGDGAVRPTRPRSPHPTLRQERRRST